MTPERMQQVDRLFQEALELPPGERAAFLNESCDGDESLRCEVEALLEADAEAGSLIGAPAYAVAAPLLEDDSQSLLGKSIGHYRIISLLGKGGMGEVYRARDSKLHREVAIKVLPADFTADRKRLSRFEREAIAASALNHPSILTIYEIGQDQGLHFMATEFIDGITLRQWMQRQARTGKDGNGSAVSSGDTLAEALEIIIQVTNGLVAAHQAGIVHRDIKPENLMLRRDGYVKILDFGIAKLTERKTTAVDAVEPEMVSVHTEPGAVMGTARYMSPEQARGEQIDERSDIFSLGVVLYEMVAGRPPFRGRTAFDVIAALLRAKPARLTQVAPGAPPELERIVSRALQKDRQKRYQTSLELLTELKELEQQFGVSARLKTPLPSASSGASPRPVSGQGKAATPATPQSFIGQIKQHKLGVVFAFVTLVAAVAGLGFALYKLLGQNQTPYSTGLAPQIVPVTSYPGRENYPVFSPDGAQLAFAWTGESGDNTDIYIKRIGGETHLRLTTNPAEEFSPAWSPDGNQIAFIRRTGASAGVFVVSSLGGPERELISNIYASVFQIDNEDARLAWSPDGKYLALSANADVTKRVMHIYLFSFDTQELRQISSLPAVVGTIRNPAFSPDGQTLAFIHGFGNIYLVQVDGDEPRPLLREAQLIYGLAFMPDGKEIIFSSRRAGHPTLWRMSVSGGDPEPVLPGGNQVGKLTLPRQGNRLAYTETIMDSNIWQIELPGEGQKQNPPVKLIASTQRDDAPNFSPDGKQIAFTSRRAGHQEIWLCDSDGLNLVQLTSLKGAFVNHPRWAPDGRQIAFSALSEGNWGVYVVGKGGGKPRRLPVETDSDLAPGWSRDGRWIYFPIISNGVWQIWKIPSEGGQAVQVTAHGGPNFVESPDGQFLYYSKGRNNPGIWRMPVAGGEETKVTEKGRLSFCTVWDQGIYYIDEQAKPQPTIEFFSFATFQTKQIAVLEKPRLSGISVSSDGRRILWSQIDQSESDIMLIENFR